MELLLFGNPAAGTPLMKNELKREFKLSQRFLLGQSSQTPAQYLWRKQPILP